MDTLHKKFEDEKREKITAKNQETKAINEATRAKNELENA